MAGAGLVAWKFLPDTAADEDVVDTIEADGDDSDMFGISFRLTPEDELALETESYRPVLGD